MGEAPYDAGDAAAVTEGVMHTVQVDGAPVILTKIDGEIYAVTGTCPHAGAPLSEGILAGDHIICPWHKAAFCARSGRLLEPPAVDSLPRFDVHAEEGRIKLTPARPAAVEPQRDGRCFVIIGAGAAGAVTAQTLREEGFGGRIVMLDRENRVPYDRTLLSKYFLSGEKGAETTPLQSQAYYDQHGIERLTATVTRIDPQQRRVTCADGTAFDYDAAVVAVGAAATKPDLPGGELEGVFTLRSRADAEAILAQAERSRRAVILGTSFIGMEVAASLRERGLDVVVVGREAAPFESKLGAQVGGAFVALHARHGVTFHLGVDIAAIEGDGAVTAVLLKTGERLAADLVVAGFGVKPATPAIEGLNLGEDGGLSVDASLRAADGLYAAGDIARFPLQGDGAPIRVEHWRVAEQHGRVAALNMLGRRARYDAVPVFWTIQYLKRLDYIGHAADWDDIVIHGDLEQPCFIAYYVTQGRVVAAVGMDRDQDMAALIVLFTRSRDWTAERLGHQPSALLGA